MTKVDHNEIGKHPEVIKKAQQDLLKMDVLVCGGCHSTFHYVEEFSDHKRKCTNIKQQLQEEKPDLKTNWAFLLWKSSQPAHSTQSVWKLYQTWALMDEKQRNAWTMAGQSIQSISRLGHGAVQETVVKVMRTITDGGKTTPTNSNAVAVNRAGLATRRAADIQAKKDDDETNTDEDYGSPKAGVVMANRKASLSPVKTIRRSLVKRTMSNSGSGDVKECFAEKVISRRMNTARNYYEYSVKWCDYPNTWEPRNHFDKAPEILAEFERLLPKPKPQPTAAVPALASRPVRNSKVRAVDQVKQWCSPGESESAANADLKRKNADSDYAEAEDSSQDEAAGSSPSPRKQIKSTTQVVSRGAGTGGQVRYYQKTVNGAATPTNAAEVVVTTSAYKSTGVVRKPGATATSPVKKEPLVKVVGKNEVTNSGIVRVGGATTSLPSTTTGQRMQRVVQTVRTPGQAPVTRTVLRPVPAASTTPSPTAKLGVVRQPPVGTPLGRSSNQYVVKRGMNSGTPATPAKVSPGALPRGIVKSPAAAQTTPPTSSTTRVVRKFVGKTEAPAPADSETSMTLCPVTGKLISTKDDANSELQRLLTNEEEEEQAAGDNSQGTETQATVEDGQIQQLITNEDGSPVLVTGEDGTIYQVAGKNADGQTLLIAQGTGEQACVYLASEDADTAAATETAAEGQATTENADATAVAETEVTQQSTSEGNSDEGQTQSMLVDQDSQDGQITAELVQADEPSADGTRRVVLLLPDGNLMVTEVNEEQYQQFNLGS